ncbi:hypothetical protein ASPWEDRAFT_170522 [Aspergillus wentii DTO 134E9]|uniref:Carboxylic ester hydrolase n=1 Tax=Aspergillus wentii DTO 134E9 TaxID=1073089 RepID=A0A1L9RPZ2_ASPWE|nr:uncharacterized protein ASPWEDRAFT_170522 [Aspergillus wentii DTO 134E9]KAI9928485.1 hypothetical protein MW887_002530 [Aspergillus wentii]OJJ37025.1 hypothetical protein ASPWEDRAFT_170522 [Aspergillus wentii DTO 134E9]
MKLLFPTMLSAFAATAMASPSVNIESGTLLGGKCANKQNSVYYKGIPYAEPPLGELRFEPPKPYGKYPNRVFNATTPATACIQFGSTFEAQGKKSEDCLYLDVWTPSHATKDSKLPVKVWVYGGSNTDGGISDSLYDGCNMAEDGTILVSINYRLGPLGFMGLNSAGIYGNQGIQDLLLGLEWVQKSISAFGGDPKKVVLFGQSAGATDVYAIATLPEAPSLINGAIAESIALPSLLSNVSLQQSGASYAKSLNCSVGDKSCLKSKTVAELKSAYKSDSYLTTGIGSASGLGVSSAYSHRFWPYVDGHVISENPMTRGIQVPTIFGSNQREGVMDALTKYDSVELVESAKPADYTKFLRDNFGPAAATIGKYYPLSLFNATLSPVISAIATVITDSQFKCAGYQAATLARQKNMPAYIYEFTHNSTCVWLDTMIQDYISVYGAAHTAELPYVFGNLHFDFANSNTTCTDTPAEMKLSKQMMSLWTAMAENGNPSTDAIHWPQVEVAKNLTTPGLVFANSTAPGSIDYSACALWNKVDALLSNKTVVDAWERSTASASASATPSATPSPVGGACRA